ncbi:snf-12 [Pristionchus pacificus]|uniref:Snf-12 n=1 Tax=Pristionchus pacificus TaxID=54126 RepID=A0A2A6BBH7_PRIPA|nr:snf-12 [Pristionchus pacificus]|eukprot:PDM63233.1 snf-12 [Pristionchus pacificus]
MICLNGAKEGATRQGQSDVRDLWNSQIEFFLSCLGFIVGVGSTLRFPAKVYQYGGGVFFIPYLICLALFGLPIVFMHLAIGQYSGLSAAGAFWKMMPISSGIGWALVILAVPVSIYYNIINAWAVYYFWFSLKGFITGHLPWESCEHQWAQKFNCCDLRDFACLNNTYTITAPEAYFHFNVLGRDEDGDLSLGPVQAHLFLALAAAWIFVFIGVFKGIGSIGWTAAVTATVPYLLLVILLLRGTSLPGANKGLHFLFTPNFDKLWSLEMWKSAAEQVFYELGIDAGPLISMASFSRFRNNIYRDAVLLVIVDALTSVLCGMVIFSFVGFIAHRADLEITDVLQHDPSYLAFTVYPGVTSFMALGPLWAALFFAMLMLSAIDAEFAWLEMIASSVMYQLGEKDKRVEDRILFFLCILGFIIGIPLTCKGGIYLFHSIESLNANWNSFSLGLMQIVLICYFYGVGNFMEDIREMLRFKPVPERISDWSIGRRVAHFFGPTGGYIKWSWCLFCPIILIALLLASLFSYERVSLGPTILPIGYELIAWVAMVGPIMVIPLTAAYTLYDAKRRSRVTTDDRDLHERVAKRNTEGCKRKGGQRKERKETDRGRASVHGKALFSYIDPASRGPSVRVHPAAFEGALFEPNDYGRMAGRISEWQTRDPERAMGESTSSGDEVEAHEMSLFGPPPASQKLSESLRMRQAVNDTPSTSRMGYNEQQPKPRLRKVSISPRDDNGSSTYAEKQSGSETYDHRRTAFVRKGGEGRARKDTRNETREEKGNEQREQRRVQMAERSRARFDSSHFNMAAHKHSSAASSVSAPPIPSVASLLSLVSSRRSEMGDSEHRTRSKSIGSADAKDLEIVDRDEKLRRNDGFDSPSNRSSASDSSLEEQRRNRATVVRRHPLADSIESLGVPSSISITPIDHRVVERSLSSIAIYEPHHLKPDRPTNKLSALKRPAPIGIPSSTSSSVQGLPTTSATTTPAASAQGTPTRTVPPSLSTPAPLNLPKDQPS